MRDKVSPAPKPIAPSISQQLAERPEPKTLTNPSGNLQRPGLSIKKMMLPVEGEQQSLSINKKDLPRNDFHFDDVKMHWRRYANDMKLQGKETFYNAMIKREPKLKDDTHLILEVDNQIQIDLINAEIENLITYMRTSLMNFEVFLEVKLTSNQQEEVKFQNGKDKFTSLSRKYPNLHSLKSTFNLDVDY